MSSSDPTSSDPTSSDPTSSDPTSGEPTSGDPTSRDPTSRDPASGEAIDLPPEVPFEGEDVDDAELGGEAGEDDDESLADRARHTGVGVEDPNIVGDVGPTDIPPGGDPDNAGSDVPWVEPDPT